MQKNLKLLLTCNEWGIRSATYAHTRALALFRTHTWADGAWCSEGASPFSPPLSSSLYSCCSPTPPSTHPAACKTFTKRPYCMRRLHSTRERIQGWVRGLLVGGGHRLALDRKQELGGSEPWVAESVGAVALVYCCNYRGVLTTDKFLLPPSSPPFPHSWSFCLSLQLALAAYLSWGQEQKTELLSLI